MSSFPPDRRGLLTAALTLVLVTAACSGGGQPGVRILTRSAELVFGVKDVERSNVQAAQENQLQTLQDSAPISAEIEAPVVVPPPRAPRIRRAAGPPPRFEETPQLPDEPAPPPAPRVCRTDGFTSVAAKRELTSVVPSNVTPASGFYRWNGQATVTPNPKHNGVLDEAHATTKGLTAHYRLIPDAARPLGTGSFSYDVVQPAPPDRATGAPRFLRSTIQVNPGFAAVRNPADVVVALPRVRPPDSGILLTRTELDDANLVPVPGVAPFEPVTPLLLLPLPVAASETWSSTAVDPRTGKTVRFDGATVQAPARVNACGEPVDGWLVTAPVAISNSGGESDNFEYDFVVAPQYGGLLIGEKTIHSPSPPTPVHDPTNTTTTTTTCPTTTTSSSTTTTTSSATTTTTAGCSTTTTTAAAPTPTIPRGGVVGDTTVPGGKFDRLEVDFSIGQTDPTPRGNFDTATFVDYPSDIFVPTPSQGPLDAVPAPS